MKLPRWLVIAMLTTSLLAGLAAAGWWWVTWPERTANRFSILLGGSDFDAANRILSNASLEQVNEAYVHCHFGRSAYSMPLESVEALASKNPTTSDLMLCRRLLGPKVGWYSNDSYSEGRVYLQFVAVGNSVRVELSP